jgi:hypothetical protein
MEDHNDIYNNSTTEDVVIFKLKQIISYSLDHYLYDNAVFFAERLKCYYSKTTLNSEESILILAQCFVKQNAYQKAYSLLKDCTSPPCLYLLAQCCLQLNHLPQGESILLELIKHTSKSPHGSSSALPVASTGFTRSDSFYSCHESISTITLKKPDLAAIYSLLGMICR